MLVHKVKWFQVLLCITKNSIKHQSFVYTQLNDKKNSPISNNSGATTLGQSGPGSNNNEGALHISQSSSITGASPSDRLVSYPVHLLGALTPQQRCSWCILQPQPTRQKWNRRFTIHWSTHLQGCPPTVSLQRG